VPSGIYHHIAGAYLLRYAQESSWRDDSRRVSYGDQFSHVTGVAMNRAKAWILPAIGSGTSQFDIGVVSSGHFSIKQPPGCVSKPLVVS
jgi:hypothetical protein